MNLVSEAFQILNMTDVTCTSHGGHALLHNYKDYLLVSVNSNTIHIDCFYG